MATIWFAVLVTAAVIVFYKILDYLIRKPMLSDFQKKCVFITGCDSGFGHSTAKHLDSLGVTVFAGCFTEKGEKELRKQCSSRLKTIHVDLTKTETIEKAFQFVKENIPSECNGLWGILNNAGTSGQYLGPPEFFTMDDYKHVVDVNLMGMVEVNHIFAPLVKKAKGRIVNTSSIGGIFANRYSAPYTISKFAVEGYSDTLRRELQLFGVSVHIIEPAAYQTECTANLKGRMEDSWERLDPKLKEEYGQDFCKDFVKNDVRAYENNTSEQIFEVTKAYAHALFSRFPRARYLVPGKNGRIIWFLTKLPEWASDALYEMSLPSRALPKSCSVWSRSA